MGLRMFFVRLRQGDDEGTYWRRYVKKRRRSHAASLSTATAREPELIVGKIAPVFIAFRVEAEGKPPWIALGQC